jgi:hypothetical protein
MAKANFLPAKQATTLLIVKHGQITCSKASFRVFQRCNLLCSVLEKGGDGLGRKIGKNTLKTVFQHR